MPATDTVKITLGGKEHSVPALTIRGLRVCWDDIRVIGAAPSPLESVSAMLRVVAAAMSPKDADARLEELLDVVTMEDAERLSQGVVELFAISGLRQAAPGAGGAPAAGSTATGTPS